MGEKLTFKDDLLEYYFNLTRIKSDIERSVTSQVDSQNSLRINLHWFRYIRNQLLDYDDYIEEIRDKRTLNRKEFRLPESQRCPGCDDGKPYKVIKYRDILIPIYDDDYGQQDFAVVFGKVISGGSYNYYSYIEFINCVDYELEQQYIDDKYDMESEIIEESLEEE